MDPFQLIWDPKFLEYDFGPAHPFQERYRELAVALFDADRRSRERPVAHVAEIPIASRVELERFHEPRYIDRVERAGESERPGFLDRGDTPGFPHCHDAAARIVGGALRAVEMLLTERSARRAFHPAGGL
ncbi:MAG: acetoin utilization protein AcuC, partial [Thermoplasmata archaeon]|nr:acetoin utilization protein AcuC [Thermoplasmata archaeon]